MRWLIWPVWSSSILAACLCHLNFSNLLPSDSVRWTEKYLNSLFSWVLRGFWMPHLQTLVHFTMLFTSLESQPLRGEKQFESTLTLTHQDPISLGQQSDTLSSSYYYNLFLFSSIICPLFFLKVSLHYMSIFENRPHFLRQIMMTLFRLLAPNK